MLPDEADDDQTTDLSTGHFDAAEDHSQTNSETTSAPEHSVIWAHEHLSFQEAGGKGDGANPDLEEVQPQPLDITMPTDSCVKTVTYFVLLPIVFPLWLTLPDTRKQSGEFQTGLTFHFSGWGARGGGGSTFRPFMAWHLSRAHYIRCLFANHYPPMAYPARHQKDVMWVKSCCDKLELLQTVAPSRCYHQHLTHMSHLCFILSVAPALQHQHQAAPFTKLSKEIGWFAGYETLQFSFSQSGRSTFCRV